MIEGDCLDLPATPSSKPSRPEPQRASLGVSDDAGASPKFIACAERWLGVAVILPLLNHVLQRRSQSPVTRRLGIGSCAPPRASPASGATRAGGTTPAISSHQSTIGSPRAWRKKAAEPGEAQREAGASCAGRSAHRSCRCRAWRGLPSTTWARRPAGSAHHPRRADGPAPQGLCNRERQERQSRDGVPDRRCRRGHVEHRRRGARVRARRPRLPLTWRLSLSGSPAPHRRPRPALACPLRASGAGLAPCAAAADPRLPDSGRCGRRSRSDRPSSCWTC